MLCQVLTWDNLGFQTPYLNQGVDSDHDTSMIHRSSYDHKDKKIIGKYLESRENAKCEI